MSRRRYFEEQRSGNGAIYHCVEIDTDHDNRFEVLDLMSKDEDVDCMTYAQDTSLYSNDSFFVFV